MEESASLDKEYHYPLILYPKNIFNHEQFQVYLNGEHIGQISTENKNNFTINTQRVKNVLCVADDYDKIGSKDYMFFKVIGEPGKGHFMLQGKNLFFIKPEKNGIEILRP
jgi:hypothetical protein